MPTSADPATRRTTRPISTQAFFARVIEKGDVGNARHELGRFRTFLLTAVRHFLLNQGDHDCAAKRGGGRVHASITAPSADDPSRFVEPASDETPEAILRTAVGPDRARRGHAETRATQRRSRRPGPVRSAAPVSDGRRKRARTPKPRALSRRLRGPFGCQRTACAADSAGACARRWPTPCPTRQTSMRNWRTYSMSFRAAIARVPWLSPERARQSRRVARIQSFFSGRSRQFTAAAVLCATARSRSVRRGA